MVPSFVSHFSVGILAFVLGAVSCLSFKGCERPQETRKISEVIVVPEPIRDGADVKLDPSNDRPDVVVRWRVETDTVEVCYDAPEGMETEGTVIATEESVDIVRPWFNDPFVSYTYFDPESFEVREARYEVAPPKLVYGIEGGMMYAPPGVGSEVSLGLYAGHRNVYGIGQFVATPDGTSYRVGVRVRLGR